MMTTARKVEILAAAFYAGAYLLWSLCGEYEPLAPEPRSEHLSPAFRIDADYSSGVSNMEAACLALLLFAVGLSAASFRLRKLDGADS